MKRRHWIISRRELRGKSNMLQPAFWPPFKKARKGVHFRHCSWRTVSKSAGPRRLTFSCYKILRNKTYRARELRKRIYRNGISDFVHGFKFCGQMLERTGGMTALWLLRLHLPTLPVRAFLLVICFMCGFYD